MKMAEYIKRETLVHRLKSPHLFNITQRIFDIISEIPAADVAPVVRCKDCKHRGGVQVHCNGINIDYCKVWDCTLQNLETTFCSYGKRKDGGDG